MPWDDLVFVHGPVVLIPAMISIMVTAPIMMPAAPIPSARSKNVFCSGIAIPLHVQYGKHP